jgi:pimeloyl-ACP methyl ester carboxylesterase
VPGTPFRIAVPDEVLDDLRARLTRTRFGAATADPPWRAGADPGYLRGLVATWAGGFDWRGQEARLNSYSQFVAEIGGEQVHFVHLRAVDGPGGNAALPLLLCHGWPSTFIEMLPLADRLTNPTRFGLEAHPAFDVVIPSMPGFLFSDPPAGPATRERFARTLHELMTGVLGYASFGAFGGDIGGVTTGWLGALFPDQLLGIHMIHPPFPSTFDDRPLEPAEQAFLDAEAAYDETDGGYSAIMGTRPDTLAAAMLDSPVGLAAWILDKWRDWSDCAGDLERRFERDTLLTMLTLYWVTGSIGTSFRQYLDFEHNTPRPGIRVPAAFTLSHEPSMAGFPRSIAERACSDIRHWSEPGLGGHFLPLEEPDLMAAELRAFFGSLAPT